jgi:hypothetical protein
MTGPNPFIGMFLAVLRVLIPPCATWLVAHHYLSDALMRSLEAAITPWVAPVIIATCGLAANSQWLHHKQFKTALATPPPSQNGKGL